MRLRQIEVFHAVFTTGSVSKAAELLHVSQPSVSKVLRHTEDVLGFPLFERKGGKLTPTREAIQLNRGADKVQQQVNQFTRQINAINKSREEQLQLAATPGLGLLVAPRAVAEFRRRYPSTPVAINTLHYTEMITRLKANEIDLALAYEPNPQADIVSIPIASANFICVVPDQHALSGKHMIDAQALAAYELVSLHATDPLGKLLNAYLEKIGVQATSMSVTANTYYSAAQLALQGVGVAVVDEITAASLDIATENLVRFKKPLAFSINVLHQRDRARSRYDNTLIELFEHELKHNLGL